MKNDNLEFSISQYIDGMLAPADVAKLEAQLSEDADARQMLDEYRRLDVALRSSPLPAIRWDALSASISSAIDAADVAATRAARQRQAPVSYRISDWIRSAVMPLALAASVLIVAGIGLKIYRSRQAPTGWTTPSSGTSQIAKAQSDPSIVIDSPPGKANGPVVEEVAIGPSPKATTVGQPIPVQYGEDDVVISGSSHVAIASGVIPAHDTTTFSSYDME